MADDKKDSRPLGGGLIQGEIGKVGGFLEGIEIDSFKSPKKPMRVAKDRGLRVTLRRTRHTKKGVLTTPMHFQCAPLDEFGWDVTHNWADYDTINAGQFSRRQGRALRTLSLNMIAVDYSAPFAVKQTGHDEKIRDDDDAYGTAMGPWRTAKRLDFLVSQGTPMMLIVRNPALYDQADFKHHVTLRAATLTERGGEPDARYFVLNFTEFREPKIVRRTYGDRLPLPAMVTINKYGVATEVKKGGERLPDQFQQKIGTQRRPATLRSLAKHYYGSPSKWGLIKAKNGLSRPDGAIWDLHGDDPLTKLFEKRKRKNQPIRLMIPKPDFDVTGGATPPTPKKNKKKRKGKASKG